MFASVWGVSYDEVITPSAERSLSGSPFSPNVTAGDLRNFIFSFMTNKAPGADNIRSCDLLRNFDNLGNLLLYVLNGIISSGIIAVGLQMPSSDHLIKEVREKA